MNERLEKELIKITGIKTAKFDENDRQELLMALCKAINKMDDDEYERLSDDAVTWFLAAAEAVKKKKSLPDFDEIEGIEDDPSTEEEDADPDGDDDPDEEENSEDESDDDETSDDGEGSEDAEADAEADEDHEADAAEESENEAVEAKAHAKKRGRPPKVVAKPEADEPDDEGEDAEADEVEVKPTKKKMTAAEKRAIEKNVKKEVLKRYNPKNVTGKKDRYGLYEGTKKSDAVKLYEKGRTVNQVSEELGGRHRNVLKEMAEKGHRITKGDDGAYTITHRDDIKPKKAAK